MKPEPEANNPQRQPVLSSSDLLAGVKLETTEACKQMWDFFDENQPREVMDALTTWAREGAQLEKIYGIIMHFGEPKFVGMTDNGRKGLAMAIEYAIRQAS